MYFSYRTLSLGQKSQLYQNLIDAFLLTPPTCRQTAEYVTSTLTSMSILGSVFLGLLSAAPQVVESLTHLTAFRWALPP